MLFGRFVQKYYSLKNTVYVLTSDRILIFYKKNITTLYYNRITFLSKNIKRNGTGSIYFEKRDPFGFFHRPFSYASKSSILAFENIDDAAKIYSIINEKINLCNTTSKISTKK